MERRNKIKLLDRRGFLGSVARTGILSVLIGGSAFLLARKKETGEACNLDFVCGNCRKNRYCKLPEASFFRLNKRKTGGDEKLG
jgi:hypothetical protein